MSPTAQDTFQKLSVLASFPGCVRQPGNEAKWCPKSSIFEWLYLVSFPGSPERECTCVESLVSFLTYHDIIKMLPNFWEQKGNILFVIQPTLHSTLGVYDTRSPIAIDTCSKFPDTFTLFPVLSLRVHPRTIKVSLPPLYPRRCSCEKTYQALHTCTTSMFMFWSMGAWERG